MTSVSGKYNNDELIQFKKTFDLYYENIKSFVYYKTGDVDLADDIVHDTFLKLWGLRHKLREETIKSLLYTIAGNLVKNHFKHQKVKYNFVNESTTSGTAEPADFELEQEEFNRLLQDTIASIPEKNRVVFLMNRIEKLTYPEIASRLGLSVKAIEKRMNEALKILRKHIKHKV